MVVLAGWEEDEAAVQVGRVVGVGTREYYSIRTGWHAKGGTP